MRVLSALVVAVSLGFGVGAAAAQGWQPPADSARCPSKWGAADQRGSANHMKPESSNRMPLRVTTVPDTLTVPPGDLNTAFL